MASSSLTMGQSHFYAQKLNNSAALCIEIGHYDRAIHSLSKALRLSRDQSDAVLISCCPCSDCSLDGCIAYSENTPSLCNTSSSTGRGIVYEQPIKVPPRPIVENHNMGRSLFLIVTFNLALAHHLSCSRGDENETRTAATETTLMKKSIHSKGNKIKKALQLYELSCNWYHRISSTGHECKKIGTIIPPINASIRFQMIICNNLSHVHRLASNYSEQRQCLQHLLSTVMVAVEYKTRANSSNATTTTTTVATSNNSETNNESIEPSTRNSRALCTENLEGFLMNASHLFLQSRCAEAA